MTATAFMNKQFDGEKNKKAAAYTLVITACLLAILFLVSWRLPPPEEIPVDLGVEVNLGNSDFGTGDIRPEIPGDPAPEQSQTASSTPQQSAPAQPDEDMTDEDSKEPDAAPLPKKTEAVKPQAKPVATMPQVSKPTTKPAEPKPQLKSGAQMGTLKGGNGTGGNGAEKDNYNRNYGQGNGNGIQGKPGGTGDGFTGSGSGKIGVAVSRGLQGRGSPFLNSFEDDFNENAKIAVEIRINEDGKVISAVYQAKGSTSSANNLKQIAIKNAFRLKGFSKGTEESIGTVIFNLKVN